MNGERKTYGACYTITVIEKLCKKCYRAIDPAKECKWCERLARKLNVGALSAKPTSKIKRTLRATTPVALASAGLKTSRSITLSKGQLDRILSLNPQISSSYATPVILKKTNKNA